MFKFHEILKQLRSEEGLTQKELASGVGIPDSVISDFENGNRLPTIQNAISLAVYFDVSLDYLIDLPDDTSILVEGTGKERRIIRDDIYPKKPDK